MDITGDDGALRSDATPRAQGLRADAERNRDRIVRAASALVVSSGPDVPLEAVARSAGVGIATLYRRFPDRQALLSAVAHDALETVLARVRDVVSRATDPWAAITDAFAWSPGLRVVLHLAGSRSPDLDAVLAGEQVRELREALLLLVEEMLVEARVAGAVRAEVTGADVVLVLSGVSRTLPADDRLAALAYSRALDILFHGIRDR